MDYLSKKCQHTHTSAKIQSFIDIKPLDREWLKIKCNSSLIINKSIIQNIENIYSLCTQPLKTHPQHHNITTSTQTIVLVPPKTQNITVTYRVNRRSGNHNLYMLWRSSISYHISLQAFLGEWYSKAMHLGMHMGTT